MNLIPTNSMNVTHKVETPKYDHVYQYQDVYEPAEDTFLLLDALENDMEHLKRIKPGIVLEIGSGSGLVTTFVSTIVGKSALYICTDKNPSASLCTLETGIKNGVQITSIITSFIDGLLPWLENKVDVLLFNPPYVVTPSEEITKGGISYAWAGGVDGREVMDIFFPMVPHILSSKGTFYLVVVKENNPAAIIEIMAKYGLEGSILMTRRTGPEVLSILKFVHQKMNCDDHFCVS